MTDNGFSIANRRRKVDSFSTTLEHIRVCQKWSHQTLYTVVAAFTPAAWQALADTASTRNGVRHGAPSEETKELVLARIEGKAVAEAFRTIERNATAMREAGL